MAAVAAEDGLRRVHGLDDEEGLTGAYSRALSAASLYKQLDQENQNTSLKLTLYEPLGLGEFFSLDVWRASAGELLGTAVLVFMLDSIVISTYEPEVRVPLLPSILAAITVAILLMATSPVSGGHLNPVVSFSAGLVGVISLSRAVVYIMAQCLGAVLGALALKAVVSSDMENHFSLGGCTITAITAGPEGPITEGLNILQAFLLEIICTFVFLFASIWMAYDPRQAKSLGFVTVFSIIGVVVGLLVFVSTTVTTSKGYSGAGMNPAKCLGAAIVRGGHLWDGHWVFWVGPSISCVAFYLYTKIIPRQHFHSEGSKHDFSNVLRVSCGSLARFIRGFRKKATER